MAGVACILLIKIICNVSDFVNTCFSETRRRKQRYASTFKLIRSIELITNESQGHKKVESRISALRRLSIPSAVRRQRK
jgi:hypothetical protein